MPLAKDRAITTKGARALFNSSFITRRRKLVYTKLCTVVDSHVESDFAKNIGTVPQLEEVIDDVNAPPIDDFRDYTWSWTNRLYRSKANLQRSIMDFDQTGQSFTLIHSMGARLANFPDRLLFTRLLNASTQLNSGEESTPGTAVPLFSASHLAPIGSSTQQNNIVTGTTPVDFCTTAATQAVAQQLISDFRAVKSRLRSFLDDHGEPWHNDDLKAENLVIICGPLLEIPFQQAFFSGMINASDNVVQGGVREIISSNYIPVTGVDAADWYLCVIGELQRPFVYSRFRRITDDEIEDAFTPDLQEGVGIDMDDLRELSSIRLETNMGHQGMNADVDVMENDRFLISAQWRGEILGGEWRNAIQVNNAAT